MKARGNKEEDGRGKKRKCKIKKKEKKKEIKRRMASRPQMYRAILITTVTCTRHGPYDRREASFLSV